MEWKLINQTKKEIIPKEKKKKTSEDRNDNTGVKKEKRIRHSEKAKGV